MTEPTSWRYLISLLCAGLLIYLLAPVLSPFAAAAVLAYMANPLVEQLVRWRLTRTLAVVALFIGLTLLLVLLILVLIPLLEKQWLALFAGMMQWLDWLQDKAMPWLQVQLGLSEAPNLGSLKEHVLAQWKSMQGLAARLFGSVSRSGAALLGWLINLLLIPVVSFYLLRDGPRLQAQLRELLPRRIEPEVVQLARAADDVLGQFFRGQLLVMLALAVIYSAGLWLIGLDLALIIGAISGLVSFVPYLGLIIGLLTASIAALMQFHELSPLLYVLLVFGIAQILESVLLTPLLLGDRIGLHPVAVIFAVLAGGHLFGFLGVLVALPVAAVLLVLLRRGRQLYLQSHFYSTTHPD